ncbi:MAG: permease-like cell division protein FtsX [Prevotella sp.]|jgi:cell division transport system permease protein|nr:permease-like cell division protein FtsX [Prevotella sp.]
MGKKTKTTGSRHGLQVVTLCISTTMVLVLLGLVVFTVLTARNLSSYVKENLTVTVVLGDDMTQQERGAAYNRLRVRPYVYQITYISKEQAKKENSEELGSDPTDFVGFNPFPATFEIQLTAEYANSDSVLQVKKELLSIPKISEVNYPEDLMDKVNSNLSKISLILLILAVLLTIVSFSLISNSVRLSVYSRRFLIHTMKLVGASWSFIRRPFLRRAIGVGVVAALLAIAILGGAVYGLYVLEPTLLTIIGWEELTITAAAVLLFGIVITAFCAYLAVNRFLKMTAGELYKI